MTNYIKSFSISTDTINPPKNNNVNIHFNQGDINTAQLIVTITHNNQTMDLSSATSVEMLFLRPDNLVISQDLTSAITSEDAEQGKLTMILNSDSLAVVGTVQCEPHVTYPNNQSLVAQRFSFTVDQQLSVK